MANVDPISLERVKSYPLEKRKSKVTIDDLGKPWRSGGTMDQWLDSLPNILAAKDFRKITGNIVTAFKKDRQVLLAMGAHAIKVGLNPVIIDLMERGIVTGLAMNGAGIIHDAELAMVGHTSEDVAAHLGEGKFGMAEETGEFLNAAIKWGAEKGVGLGRAVGAGLVKEGCKYNHYSLLARAFELEIPLTVHVAIGTDIIHFHPSVDGAAIGKTSHMDFRIFAGMVSGLEDGVFINLGSAVIMPEVFLKALSLVRNLGHPLKKLTTVNMDFNR
ncbi:MAG: hypothetical protein ABII06_02790, partial [Pseudomonadota bacterium]